MTGSVYTPNANRKILRKQLKRDRDLLVAASIDTDNSEGERQFAVDRAARLSDQIRSLPKPAKLPAKAARPVYTRNGQYSFAEDLFAVQTHSVSNRQSPQEA